MKLEKKIEYLKNMLQIMKNDPEFANEIVVDIVHIQRVLSFYVLRKNNNFFTNKVKQQIYSVNQKIDNLTEELDELTNDQPDRFTPLIVHYQKALVELNNCDSTQDYKFILKKYNLTDH